MRLQLSVGDCKREARLLLKERAVPFALFAFFSLLFFAFAGFALFYGVTSRELEGVLRQDQRTFLRLLVGGLVLLSFLLFVYPFYEGMKAYLLRLAEGKAADHALFFLFYFHPRRYLFTLKRGTLRILHVAFALALLWLASGSGLHVADDLLFGGRTAAAALVLFATLLLLLLILLLFRMWAVRDFPLSAAFLSAPLLSYRQLRTVCTARMRDCRGSSLLARLNMSFLPHFILSFAFFGLPLVWIVPYYLTARSVLAKRVLSD